MVKQTEKFLETPCKIKRIVKKVVNQKPLKPQISETNLRKFNQTTFFGTNLEAQNVV